MLLADYLGNKVFDLFDKKLEEYLNEDKLQKILLACFEETKERMEAEGICIEGFNIDINKIMSVNSQMIQPNLTERLLEKNLTVLFSSSIILDDKDRRDSIKKEICSSYLEKARKEMLELYHIQENMDKIGNQMKEISTGVGEISTGVNELKYIQNQQFKNVTSYFEKNIDSQLNFIDELEYSRAYFYLVLEISCIIDEEEREEFILGVLEEVQERGDLGFGCEFYRQDMMQCIAVNFDEPVIQRRLKEFLNVLDDVFFDNNIKIYKVRTY